MAVPTMCHSNLYS